MSRRPPRVLLLWLLLLLASCATPYADQPPYVPALLREGGAPPDADPGDGDALPARQLTLADCVEYSLAHHRSIQIQDRRVLIAQDRVDEAVGLVLPQLGAEARYTARNSTPGATFGGETFPTGEKEMVAGRAGVLVPVYDSGRAWYAFQASRVGVESAGLQSRLARQELVLSVQLAYYRVLEAQRIREVVVDSIAVVERQLATTRDLEAQGLAAPSDVLTVEVRLQERELEMVRAEHNVARARATLNRLLTVEVDRVLTLEDVLERPPREKNLVEAVRIALDNRLDLALLDQQVSLAEAQWKATRSSLGPRLFAFGEFTFTSDEFVSDQDWLSAGLGVEVPFFDGGVTYAQLRRQRREIAEARDLRAERADDITLEVQQALLAVQQAAERVPLARQSVALAEENLRVAQDRFTEGLASSLDVLIEEERLARARASNATALYDHHATHAALRFALGLTRPPGDPVSGELLPPPPGNE